MITSKIFPLGNLTWFDFSNIMLRPIHQLYPTSELQMKFILIIIDNFVLTLIRFHLENMGALFFNLWAIFLLILGSFRWFVCTKQQIICRWLFLPFALLAVVTNFLFWSNTRVVSRDIKSSDWSIHLLLWRLIEFDHK